MISIPLQVDDRSWFGTADGVPGEDLSGSRGLSSSVGFRGCCRWSDSLLIGEQLVVIAMGEDDLLVFRQRGASTATSSAGIADDPGGASFV